MPRLATVDWELSAVGVSVAPEFRPFAKRSWLVLLPVGIG